MAIIVAFELSSVVDAVYGSAVLILASMTLRYCTKLHAFILSSHIELLTFPHTVTREIS